MHAGQFDFRTVDAREAGDVAVVMIEEQRIGHESAGLDPIYLVRVEQEWRVLLIGFRHPLYGPSEERQDRCVQLAKWFEERAREIRRRKAEQGAKQEQ